MKDMTPFLMFAGQAEEAMRFYVSLFPNSEITSITRYGTEEEIDAVVAKLAEDGQVFLPLAEYPFSRKFASLNDRFGASWQLSLRSG